MSKLIIVCGLSGSGKTTVAEAVSRELGVVCLHKDSIKERLYDAMGLTTLEDSKRLGVWTMELLMGLVEEQIARGVDVMVEAPFNFPEDYRSLSVGLPSMIRKFTALFARWMTMSAIGGICRELTMVGMARIMMPSGCRLRSFKTTMITLQSQAHNCAWI